MTDLQSLSDVLRGADAALLAGKPAAAQVWPTGFEPLDTYLAGGLRSGELTLLGGPQGLGKTTLALQMLRNVVHEGQPALMFSYEHDASTLLERLVALEAGNLRDVEAVSLRRIRESMEAVDGTRGGLEDRLAATNGGAEAVRAVAEYGEHVHLHRSSGASTTLAVIREVVEQVTRGEGRPPFVVVDYLQKVATDQTNEIEEERVTRIVEGLKDLALDLDLPVLAIVAADREGLVAGKRLRVHNLRGSSALAYEADVVLLMNDKFDVVARHHLVYNVSNAERFRDYVVVTIEKNRSGLDKIDLEFRKRFEQSRFDTDGRSVDEQLVDERVYVE